MIAADRAKRQNRIETIVSSIIGIVVLGVLARADIRSLVTEWSPQAAIVCAILFIGGGIFIGYLGRLFFKLVLRDHGFRTSPEPFEIEDEFGNRAVLTPNGRHVGVRLID